MHDGLCQQLAAIAYCVAMLGDQLDEKKLPESSKAGRIGGLLQESIQQTRGVARGLFPVRLDETGLAAALAELAATLDLKSRLRHGTHITCALYKQA